MTSACVNVSRQSLPIFAGALIGRSVTDPLLHLPVIRAGERSGQGSGAGATDIVMRVSVLRMAHRLVVVDAEPPLQRAELMAQRLVVEQPHAPGHELRQKLQIVLRRRTLAGDETNGVRLPFRLVEADGVLVALDLGNVVLALTQLGQLGDDRRRHKARLILAHHVNDVLLPCAMRDGESKAV